MLFNSTIFFVYIKFLIFKITKYTYFCLYFFVKFFFGIFTYLLIIVLRPLILIRIGELESRAIGHFALPVEVYLSERDFNIHSSESTIDLFYFNKIICNYYLANKWKCYFYILPNIFLEYPHRFMLNYMKNSKHIVPYRHWKLDKQWQLFDIHNILQKSEIHIKFSCKEILIGDAFLKKMDLYNKNIIGFHARDPSYREGKDVKPGFRDSDINNYEFAARSVVANDFKAVRIGRVVKNKLVENTSMYDYSSSDYSNDFMDVYLLSKINLLVCSGSGIESLALCFRKPLVCVNIAEWATLHFYDNTQYTLFIPKKYYWARNDVPLTLKEIVLFGVNKFTYENEYKHLGIYVIENSQSEINDVVLEALDLLAGKHLYSDEEKEMQKKFQRIAGLYLGKKLNIPIGKKFLSENNYLLKM